MKSLSERFFSFVEKRDNGCWIWMGAKQSKGYGLFTRNYKSHLAHRISWEFTYGFVPEGLVICHRCDTPSCVNPEHLFLGDNKDNALDKMKKGRHVQAYGNTKLRLEDVLEIRKLWMSGTLSQLELADRFGVKHSCIGRIINTDKWRGNNLPPIPKDVWNDVHRQRKIKNFSGSVL